LRLFYPQKVNVPSGKSLTFGEARVKSRKVASALFKMGFKKGDVLFFVTTECVDLYILQLAVWMLGGAVRGTSAFESHGIYYIFSYKIKLTHQLKESYVLQMSECNAKFVCVDIDTDEKVRKAAQSSSVANKTFLSVGDVPVDGTTHIGEMISEDGTSKFLKL
jgi:long-subunit acyl-CoA synthetase (AMP-forming)